MKKTIACLFFAGLLSACASLPKAAPVISQHDLGGNFPPLARAALPVQGICVSASPLLAGHAMAYREASQPTARGAYAFNRWAAPPANLVEQALNRMLPIAPAGACRLNFQLADAILEIDDRGAASVLLSGTLRLARDDKGSMPRKLVDLRIPLAKASPAAEAAGLREAVQLLASQTADWVEGEAGKLCH